MIITQDIARIAQALLKDTTGSLVEATWQSLTPLNLTPGQMVHGEVMANFANSRYLVRIANELLHMELPLNLQPGQAVELTYVTDEPRLVFSLSKSGNSATPVQISDTGRWLNTLAQGTGGTQAASSLPRPSLVISGPPRDPALLAEGLKNVLSRSGVFYESHLAQWVQGEYPLTDLLREPQGQLSPLAGRLPAEGNGATTTLHGVRVSPGETPPAPAPPAVTPGLPLEEGVTPPPPTNHRGGESVRTRERRPRRGTPAGGNSALSRHPERGPDDLSSAPRPPSPNGYFAPEPAPGPGTARSACTSPCGASGRRGHDLTRPRDRRRTAGRPAKRSGTDRSPPAKICW